MNAYVPVRKILKVVSTHRTPKRERHLLLQDCLEPSKEPRRRRCHWKPWIVLFVFITALFYVISRRTQLFPEMHVNSGDVAFVPYYPQEPTEGKRTEENVKPKKQETYSKSDVSTPVAVEGTTRNDTLRATTEHQKYSQDNMPLCQLKKPYGKVTINKTSVNISEENVFPLVKKGGYYHPPDCKPRHRVGIIVPYRNRAQNLGIFLYNIHPFLMQQKLEYQIFVIEQEGQELFNKGRLYNAGFREIMKFNNFHCLILHDLDLLPLEPSIMYTCPTLPRHMCAMINDTDVRRQFNITYNYKSLFGGVVAMSVEQFERANGFSNLYFGWGAEDNDMFWRLRSAGYPVMRYQKSTGVYLVLPHRREPENPYRNHLLSRATDRYKTDGLSNLEYYVISTKFYHLFTYIMVNINPRGDNITELYTELGYEVY